MRTTITLRASASYGNGGKQYVVGTKGGKRRESAEYETDEPGLYVRCDIDRKGNKDETYCVVERKPDGSLVCDECDKAQAMSVAKLMDSGMTFPEACVAEFGDGSAYYVAPAPVVEFTDQ